MTEEKTPEELALEATAEVEEKEKIGRRLRCHFQMNIPAGLKSLEDSRRVDSAEHQEEVEERFIT